MVWGNVILGGIIGIIIDFSTGAVYKVKPDEISVGLEPTQAAVSGEGGQPQAVVAPTEVSVADPDLIQLDKLAELKAKGALTEAEFNQKKKELLSQKKT